MKEEPSLLLKFSGEGLDVRSIPIYELGDTLVAVQRIIHKTFLFENDRLKKAPRHSVWNLTARIPRSGARWGLWATRYSELSTNPRGGVLRR